MSESQFILSFNCTQSTMSGFIPDHGLLGSSCPTILVFFCSRKVYSLLHNKLLQDLVASTTTILFLTSLWVGNSSRAWLGDFFCFHDVFNWLLPGRGEGVSKIVSFTCLEPAGQAGKAGLSSASFNLPLFEVSVLSLCSVQEG